MKEILKHGKTFAKAKCEECGCEFWYTVADVFNSNSNDTNEFFVLCPECDKAIKVEKGEKYEETI